MGSTPIVKRMKIKRNKNYNSYWKKTLQDNLFLTPKILFILKSIFSYWNKSFLVQMLSNHVIHYGTPISVTYRWSFRSLVGICLIAQIISGLLLVIFYTAHIDLVFSSLEYLIRDVYNGWFVRYIRLNCASMFFSVVYCCLLRGLFYNLYSEPRELLWISGVIFLLLMMATVFLGYVLPCEQISVWGATVIPKIGQSIFEWLWSGYTVNNLILNWFSTFYFNLLFFLVSLVCLHLALLHSEGPSSSMSDFNLVNQGSFYLYYFVKDLLAGFSFICLFVAFVIYGYGANQLGDLNNYITENSIYTQRCTLFEWCFLSFYAMLRLIPHKVAEILTTFFSLIIYFILSFLNFSLIKNSIISSRLFFYFFFIAVLVGLIWLAQSFVGDINILTGQFVIVYYFFFLIVILPFSGLIITFLKYTFFVLGFWTKGLKRLWRLINYAFVYLSTYGYSVFCAIVLYEGRIAWLISFLVFYSVVFQFAYSGEIILMSPLTQNPFDIYPPLQNDAILPRPTLYDKFIIAEENIYPKPKFPSIFHIIFFIILVPTVAIYNGWNFPPTFRS